MPEEWDVPLPGLGRPGLADWEVACPFCGAATVLALNPSGVAVAVNPTPAPGGNLELTIEDGGPPKVRVPPPPERTSSVGYHMLHAITCQPRRQLRRRWRDVVNVPLPPDEPNGGT